MFVKLYFDTLGHFVGETVQEFVFDVGEGVFDEPVVYLAVLANRPAAPSQGLHVEEPLVDFMREGQLAGELVAGGYVDPSLCEKVPGMRIRFFADGIALIIQQAVPLLGEDLPDEVLFDE